MHHVTPAPQRIAFVCPRFAEGATVGGVETLLKAQAQRAAAAGNRVTFLATCAQNHFTWANELPPGQRRIDGLDVIFFPVDADRDIATFLRVQAAISRKSSVTAADELLWLKNSVNSRALCNYLRAHGAEFDWIIMGPYLFGLTFFCSQVLPAKTLLVPCLHDEGFAYTRAMREMFRSVAGCLFNTASECALARSLYDLKPEACAVVGMGLEPFEASSDAFARKHSLTAPYVIYAGRREEGKATPLLLDYMTLFRRRTRKDIKLVLAGSGEFTPPSELRPHLLDAGFLAEEEKHEALAGAVAFCHPSVNESFGIVILESWLARAPVLVSARCAVNLDHCRKSNGGLWFGVYPEFEEVLLALLQQESLRRALGEAGRAYVLREYAWDTIAQKFQDALRQFAARRI
ncbi:MAG: glycosyltransferase family 4 protein [Lentisphaerae bacterium]|nr:glycosyltransferase family 4 protein [Lentisphaerota bacterium]